MLYLAGCVAAMVWLLWLWRRTPHTRQAADGQGATARVPSGTLRWLRVHLTRQSRKAFRALSKPQVWLLGGGLWLSVLACLTYLQLPHGLLQLAFATVLCFVLMTVLTLSVLFSLPLFRSLWQSAPSRLLSAVVPGFILFLAKLYANIQVTDLLSVTSSVAPTAVWLGAIYVLCLAMAVCLIFVAVGFGVLLVPLWGGRTQVYFSAMHRAKMLGWVVLIGGVAATAGVSGTVLLRWLNHASPATLLAAVYAYDAAPGTFCSLSRAHQQDPYRVLHLPSLEQRAMLVHAEAPLLQPVRFWQLGTPAAPGPWLTVDGAVDCFAVPASHKAP